MEEGESPPRVDSEIEVEPAEASNSPTGTGSQGEGQASFRTAQPGEEEQAQERDTPSAPSLEEMQKNPKLREILEVALQHAARQLQEKYVDPTETTLVVKGNIPKEVKYGGPSTSGIIKGETSSRGTTRRLPSQVAVEPDMPPPSERDAQGAEQGEIQAEEQPAGEPVNPQERCTGNLPLNRKRLRRIRYYGADAAEMLPADLPDREKALEWITAQLPDENPYSGGEEDVNLDDPTREYSSISALSPTPPGSPFSFDLW